jgi:hypothetical protein
MIRSRRPSRADGPEASMHHPTLLAVALLAAAASAQSAAYTHFGTDCASPNWTPVWFQAIGLPRPGTTFHVETEASSANPGSATTTFLCTGVSRTSYGSMQLPFDVTALNTGGITFCGLLYVSCDAVYWLPRVVSTRPVLLQVPFPVPNDPRLLGATFYQQVVQHVRTAQRSDFYLSRAGEILVGH